MNIKGLWQPRGAAPATSAGAAPRTLARSPGSGTPMLSSRQGFSEPSRNLLDNIIQNINLNTFAVGSDKIWTRHGFNHVNPDFDSIWRAVYAEGILYSMDLKGRVGAFNVKDGTWNVIPCKDKSTKTLKLHLVEFKGEIFAAKRGRHGIVQAFFKLKVRDDLSEWEKEEVDCNVT